VIPGGTREHIVQTESSNTVGTSIRGKIANYSNTAMEGGQYRRLGITRIFDALVYGQRLEDLAHRFTVRVSCGRNAFGNEEFTDVPVNVHGTIAGGIRLDNNLEVEVCGKYRNGILMARQVQILTNGCRSRVSFQHSIRAIVTLITAVIMLGLILYTGAVSEIGFLETIYQFFLTWLVVFGVILIFSLLFWFTRAGMIARLASQNQNRIPWGTHLIISFIITFIIFQFL